MIQVADEVAVTTVDEVQEAVRLLPRLLPRGGGTKPALSVPPPGFAASTLRLGGLSGIVEYEPGEYTFTARAGTPLLEIEAALAEHGQYLPFDPPLAQQGATLGGTIAAGLSGARRYRYGGLRDFLIGVRFVDGQGRLVRGGGKVVKNAAGFDLPKLMIGSLGRLGVLVEASFKVFPNPPAFATLRYDTATLAGARETLSKLAASPIDIDALDISVGDPCSIWVRIGGLESVLPERIARLQVLLGGGVTVEDEAATWQQASEFAWVPDGWALAKASTNPHTIVTMGAALQAEVGDADARLRFSAGGHLAWVAWRGELQSLDALLAHAGFASVALRGLAPYPLLGRRPDPTLLARVSSVLDRDRRFLPLQPEP